jgi:hypothetical protein
VGCRFGIWVWAWVDKGGRERVNGKGRISGNRGGVVMKRPGGGFVYLIVREATALVSE